MAARIRKGDTVVVISGRDKGKTGKVLSVMPAEGKVVVEGINLVKRHARERLNSNPIVPFNPAQHTSETCTQDSSGRQQETLSPPSQTYPAGRGMPCPCRHSSTSESFTHAAVVV